MLNINLNIINKKHPLLSFLLLPISGIYGLVAYARIKLVKPYKVGVPVVCVGNVTMGGNGKTPVAISLAKYFKSLGMQPFFITRGYKGKLQNVLVSSSHTAKEVGDEPLLLAEVAPVIVDANRVRGAKKAVKTGADIIIMDDGFQNPHLYKDFSLLVFDGTFGIGNGRVVPSGSMREFLKPALNRASAVAIVGENLSFIDKKIKELKPKLPIFYCNLEPDKHITAKLLQTSVVAFAGIGFPDKFFNMLKWLYIDVKQTYPFPDHHFYTDAEMQKLIYKAKENKAVLTTTAKDAVKIPKNFLQKVVVMPITAVWEKFPDFTSVLNLSDKEK